MNQLHEKNAQKDPKKHSLWQQYRHSQKARQISTTLLFVLPIIILVILMYTVFIRAPFNPKEGLTNKGSTNQALTSQNSTNKGSTSQGSTNNTAQPSNPSNDISINTIVTEVLNDMNAHSWDPAYQTTLINWRKSNLSQVNCGPNACDTRGHSTRKDGANDLRLLQNMYWYKSSHPGNTSMDKYIARILPTVQRQWGHTILNKGWVYFTLLEMRNYSHDTAYWNQAMLGWAASEYSLLDPQLGVQHGPVDTTAGSDKQRLQNGYRVDHALETGLALVDAGTRFNHPEWVAAGRKDVQVVISQAYDRQYHLFGRIYLIYDPKFGSHKLLDPQARMGETGQEIEALLRAGVYTHTPAYLSLAKEMLDGLETSPLRDPNNGGFYFKLFLGSYMGKNNGDVDKSIKEARQLHTLIAIHLGNTVFHNRWENLEQNLVTVAKQRLFLPGAVPGFTYRVLPSGQMYPCKTCSAPHVENWVTSEADNIAVMALQTVATNETISTKP
jgi:hypothetical protein